MALNKGRVWLGGIVGGVAWTAWSFLIGMRLGQWRYEQMQNAGLFLRQPRYLFLSGSGLPCCLCSRSSSRTSTHGRALR